MSYAVEKSGKFTSPVSGRRFAATCLLLVLLLAARAAAQGELPANYGDRPKHADRVKSDYENNLAKFKGMPDVLVLPGLLAAALAWPCATAVIYAYSLLNILKLSEAQDRRH